MPKILIIEPITITLSEDREISEFINSQKPKTRKTYTTYFKVIKQFSNQNGSEMLKDRKAWQKKIFELMNWLKQKGYSDYYIQSVCGKAKEWKPKEKPKETKKSLWLRIKGRLRKLKEKLSGKQYYIEGVEPKPKISIDVEKEAKREDEEDLLDEDWLDLEDNGE